MVLNNLGLERSNGTSKKLSMQMEEYHVPTWYMSEKTELPDRNIGVPPVRKYAIYRTLSDVVFG
jgi:hypothetical protein